MKLQHDGVRKLWLQRKQRAFDPRSPSRIIIDSFAAVLVLLLPWMASNYSRTMAISLSIAATCFMLFAVVLSVLWSRDKNNGKTKVSPIVVILVFGWNSLLLNFFAFSFFASGFGFAQLNDSSVPFVVQVVWLLVLFVMVVFFVLTSPSRIIGQLDSQSETPNPKNLRRNATVIGSIVGPVIIVLALGLDMPARIIEPIFAVSFFLFGLLFLSVGIFNLLETLTLLYQGLDKAPEM